MLCRFDDIRNKEVINIRSGRKLGYPDDFEFDSCTAKLCRLIICGKAKFFGIFGREPDIIIPWRDVEIIGADAILVTGVHGDGGVDGVERPPLFAKGC